MLMALHRPTLAAMEVVAPTGECASIVLPDQPIPVEQHAAAELQYHVEKSTGAAPPIVRESEYSGGGGAIYVGATAAAKRAGIDVTSLPANGCILKLVNEDFFIAGRDSDSPLWSNQWTIHEIRTHVGTLNGVYEFLEKQLGVKWLWPGGDGEVIPRRDSIRIEQWDQTYAPPLIHARLRDGTSMHIDFAVEGSGPFNLWSSNDAAALYRRDQGIWLRRQRFAMSTNLDARHSFQTYWEQFGAAHPDYFNLLPDGTRRSDPTVYEGSPDHVSMCVSEPKLWKTIVDQWAATRTPDDPHISAGENDNPGKCTCEKCLAWDGPTPDSPAKNDPRLAAARAAFARNDPAWVKHLGSLSDRYARFYLAVQDEARRVDPDVLVKGFAYENYVAAPAHTKLNRDILILFVPGFYFPWSHAKSEEFRRQWQGWSDAGASMMLRPNYFLDGHNLPVFFARKFGSDFRFAAEHGLLATDFDSLTGQWATQGPNLYVLARLHVDPSRSVDEVLDEYYAGFGPARDAVAEYFAHWERVSDSITDESFDAAVKKTDGNPWWGFIRLADEFFTPEVMSAGRSKLDVAARAAQGDETFKRRVEFLDAGLRNAELTLEAQRAFRVSKQTGDPAPFAAAVKKLDDYRKSIDRFNTSNISFTHWAETLCGWDRASIYR